VLQPCFCCDQCQTSRLSGFLKLIAEHCICNYCFLECSYGVPSYHWYSVGNPRCLQAIRWLLHKRDLTLQIISRHRLLFEMKYHGKYLVWPKTHSAKLRSWTRVEINRFFFVFTQRSLIASSLRARVGIFMQLLPCCFDVVTFSHDVSFSLLTQLRVEHFPGRACPFNKFKIFTFVLMITGPVSVEWQVPTPNM